MTPEQALGYEATERTRYRVKITITEGRDPCTPGTITIAGTRTLIDAQKAYIAVREESWLGGSQFGEGHVLDEYGQHIARISYNGRLWGPLPWTPGTAAVAEAPDATTAAPEFAAAFRISQSLMEA